MQLPKIPKDKRLHFIGGVIIATTVTLVLPDTVAGLKDQDVALIVTAIIGAGKEFRDSLGYGHVELNDFLATVAGAIPALVLS